MVVLHQSEHFCGEVTIVLFFSFLTLPPILAWVRIKGRLFAQNVVTLLAGFLVRQSFSRLSRGFSAVLGLVLMAVACFGNPDVSLAAWRLPGRPVPTPVPTVPKTRSAFLRLQEVSPPPATHQFKDALGDRLPQVRILEPGNAEKVGDGSWKLRVKVSDWPLIDAGSLGLGPHLLVFLDGEPPQVLTNGEMDMPPLTPGSHRLTVAAAWPWGEVVKSHGAFDQIRVIRAAANPLAVPSPGSAQLFVTSPVSSSREIGQPVLFDWLLIDSPLQNLRQNDASWRLRITVNGESFLVDQQTPLWLSGLRSGANALLWELVDGRGEPLNPPFNSVVSEIYISRDIVLPGPWNSETIDPSDTNILLGLAPPETRLSSGDLTLKDSLQSGSASPHITSEKTPENSSEKDLPDPQDSALEDKIEATSESSLQKLPPDESVGSVGDLGPKAEGREEQALPALPEPFQPPGAELEALSPESPIFEVSPAAALAEPPPNPQVATPESTAMTADAPLPELEAGARDSLEETVTPSRDVLAPARRETPLSRLGQGLQRRLGQS